MVEGISTAKIVQFHASSTKLRMRENCIIVLPVNILTGVACWLLGPPLKYSAEAEVVLSNSGVLIKDR